MSSQVILVDGIVRAFAKRLTPDVTWTLYNTWLRRRRSDLRICHLEQPYDWVDIFSNRAEPYQDLEAQMLSKVKHEIEDRGPPAEVVFLGFSMGGLTALSLASRWKLLAGSSCPGRLTFITFGTPYAGANLFDRLFARTNISYIERVVNLAETKRQARQLASYAEHCSLVVLAHSIAGDEMVNGPSARMIADWLYFSAASPNLRFGGFSFDPQTLFQPHNTLMHNPLAFAYIDGLLDGLLPQRGGNYSYVPPNSRDIAELRGLLRQ